MLEAPGRTPTCRSPPTLALPSPQPFAGLGFSRTLIALLSSNLFFFILSRPGGCKVWLIKSWLEAFSLEAIKA